jgi:hypothetical protein
MGPLTWRQRQVIDEPFHGAASEASSTLSCSVYSSLTSPAPRACAAIYVDHGCFLCQGSSCTYCTWWQQRWESVSQGSTHGPTHMTPATSHRWTVPWCCVYSVFYSVLQCLQFIDVSRAASLCCYLWWPWLLFMSGFTVYVWCFQHTASCSGTIRVNLWYRFTQICIIHIRYDMICMTWHEKIWLIWQHRTELAKREITSRSYFLDSLTFMFLL